MNVLTQLKGKYIGDKAFYKRVLLIALPMIAQHGITSFVNFLDNIMVGMIGTEQMSGVAIVNQLVFVFNICIFGGVSGAGIFGTQFYGKGDYEGQKHAFRFKVFASTMIIGLALFLFSINFKIRVIYLHKPSKKHISYRGIYHTDYNCNTFLSNKQDFLKKYKKNSKNC